MQDASPGTPMLVLLSPGVDVAGAVEALGCKLGYTQENGKYFSVSLGQGQVCETWPSKGTYICMLYIVFCSEDDTAVEHSVIAS